MSQRTLRQKGIWIAIALFVASLGLLGVRWVVSQKGGDESLLFENEAVGKTLSYASSVPARTGKTPPEIAAKCESCHAETSPGIVHDWRQSNHARSNVSCIDCHEADKTDADAREHEGAIIAAIVSPRDCSRCHVRQVREFSESLHAKAVSFIQSLDDARTDDDFLAYQIEGMPAAVRGCEQCHGAKVRVLGKDRSKRRLDPETWPNTGVGRINPDGSAGACTACHTRHKFSIAEARRPEACAQCHLGPDHPQYEIYMESKHGAIYRSEEDSWNWSIPIEHWSPQFYRAPTCATCHMSAAGKDAPSTHNVSSRLSWELERPLSVHTDDWKAKRNRMQRVCLNCHSQRWTDGYYAQADKAVELYNQKYYLPTKKLMNELYGAGALTKQKFDDELEFKFFELWHHEGRRARMGAFMMGPDYAQWHGFYELAKKVAEIKRIVKESEETK